MSNNYKWWMCKLEGDSILVWFGEKYRSIDQKTYSFVSKVLEGIIPGIVLPKIINQIFEISLSNAYANTLGELKLENDNLKSQVEEIEGLRNEILGYEQKIHMLGLISSIGY